MVGDGVFVSEPNTRRAGVAMDGFCAVAAGILNGIPNATSPQYCAS
jgi:hypothetical protein